MTPVCDCVHIWVELRLHEYTVYEIYVALVAPQFINSK